MLCHRAALDVWWSENRVLGMACADTHTGDEVTTSLLDITAGVLTSVFKVLSQLSAEIRIYGLLQKQFVHDPVAMLIDTLRAQRPCGNSAINDLLISEPSRCDGARSLRLTLDCR